MHPLAQLAQEKLPERIFNLLSHKGRQIYFPSAGILGQAAEAKGRTINGTIGNRCFMNTLPLNKEGVPVSGCEI